MIWDEQQKLRSDHQLQLHAIDVHDAQIEITQQFHARKLHDPLIAARFPGALYPYFSLLENVCWKSWWWDGVAGCFLLDLLMQTIQHYPGVDFMQWFDLTSFTWIPQALGPEIWLAPARSLLRLFDCYATTVDNNAWDGAVKAPLEWQIHQSHYRFYARFWGLLWWRPPSYFKVFWFQNDRVLPSLECGCHCTKFSSVLKEKWMHVYNKLCKSSRLHGFMACRQGVWWILVCSTSFGQYRHLRNNWWKSWGFWHRIQKIREGNPCETALNLVGALHLSNCNEIG